MPPGGAAPADPPPLLLLVLGPPAVGKMTVGMAVAARTGLRLFHNHHTIDLVRRFFEFGTPAFHRLVGEFRRRIMEEVAASDLPGLIFTYVCAFDEPRDLDAVERFADIFRARGGRVLFAELAATQEERLRRNETELRLREKGFQRDVPRSRQFLLHADASYRLNSAGEFDGRADYIKIDNTALAPDAVAERIIEAFGLARADPR